MSLADPSVFVTENDDGSAEFTIQVDDDNYRFSADVLGERAVLEYEETMLYRGVIETSEPREEVWRLLMQSDEMTAYLEETGATRVQRQ